MYEYCRTSPVFACFWLLTLTCSPYAQRYHLVVMLSYNRSLPETVAHFGSTTFLGWTRLRKKSTGELPCHWLNAALTDLTQPYWPTGRRVRARRGQRETPTRWATVESTIEEVSVSVSVRVRVRVRLTLTEEAAGGFALLIRRYGAQVFVSRVASAVMFLIGWVGSRCDSAEQRPGGCRKLKQGHLQLVALHFSTATQ